MGVRRLAAIMFTDIVNYDSLLKEDENNAIDTRKKNQRIHRRLIKKFNGRWLKEMESGVLASFSSNIDAVMCAVFILRATEEINIPLRIGIHQGDVIFEKKDVLGDGVNITSRIQNLAGTHSIVISEKVYSDIANKEGLKTEFQGEQILKGVKKPVGIYKVSCQDESLPDYSIDTGELLRPLSFRRTTIIAGIFLIALLAYSVYYFLPKSKSTSQFQKSLLIMPFENYLGTDTLDYFVAGMHDQLIGKMGRIGALQVISRTTSRAYKNTNKSIPEIAKELGINAVIETSVLCTGDSICLEVKLKNVDEGKEIWVKEFQEETGRIFNLYNIITREISDEIDMKLRPQEEMLLGEYRNVDPDALDAYFRGYENWDYLYPDSTKKAIEYFQKAIEIDPDWADPYAGLALALSTATVGSFGGWLPQTITLPRIYNNMNKALELDPNSASAHFTKAIKATWTEFDWEKAESAFLQSIELNPSDARCRAYYSHLLHIHRRTKESVHQANLAAKLDPLNPLILALCGETMFQADDYQSAIAYGEKAIAIDPRLRISFGFIGISYYSIGDFDKWFELWISQVCWNDELKNILRKVYSDQGHIVAIKEFLKLYKAYETDNCRLGPGDLIHWYLKLGDYEKAKEYMEMELDMFEELVAQSNWGMAYLGINSFYKIHKDNPRYIDLLKKMNLPVD